MPCVSLKYVKGHQDRQNNYEALPLVTQLNIDADNLAGKYQSAHGRPHPFVLMTPHAAAHLYYPEGTITANYVSDLRFRSTAPALRSYIQVKNNWTDAVMETINWLAQGKALRSMMNTRIHFIKLVHECLPTTGQQNRRDNGNRTCPRCATTKEDRDHIIRCEARTRAEWRANFRKSTREFHTKHDTAPDLVFVVVIWHFNKAWMCRQTSKTSKYQTHKYSQKGHDNNCNNDMMNRILVDHFRNS